MTAYIFDDDDFCRACLGAGGHGDKTDRDTYLWTVCDQCCGTGYKAVSVSDFPDCAEKTDARQLAGGVPSLVPSHFSSVTNTWVHDNMPKRPESTWDRMKSVERVTSDNLHDPHLRKIRETDFLASHDFDDEAYPVRDAVVGALMAGIILTILYFTL